MYRRDIQTDELLSQVLIFFALSLVFGFLIAWKLVGVDTYDPEMIVYLVFGGLSFLAFLTTLVLFFIAIRKPLLDIELNMEERTIRLFYGLKMYSFDDIKLYSFNKRHRQVRLMLGWIFIGFPLDQVTTYRGTKLTLEDVASMGEGGIEVQPKTLYNYQFIASCAAFGLFVAYVIGYGKDQIDFAGWRYIPTYIVLGISFVLMALAYGINRYRLHRYIRRIMSNKDASET